MKRSDLVKIIKEEISKVIGEGVITIFSHSKNPTEIKDNLQKLKIDAQQYIKDLRAKNYNISSDDQVIYFPNFTWAGGKQVYGPSFGVMAGSDTMIVSPIKSSKLFKVGEKLISTLVKNGKLEAYNLYESDISIKEADITDPAVLAAKKAAAAADIKAKQLELDNAKKKLAATK